MLREVMGIQMLRGDCIQSLVTGTVPEVCWLSPRMALTSLSVTAPEGDGRPRVEGFDRNGRDEYAAAATLVGWVIPRPPTLMGSPACPHADSGSGARMICVSAVSREDSIETSCCSISVGATVRRRWVIRATPRLCRIREMATWGSGSSVNRWG